MLKLKSKTNDHEDNMLYKKVVPCHLPFSGCLCLNLCATSHGYFAGKNLFLLGSFDGWTLQTYILIDLNISSTMCITFLEKFSSPALFASVRVVSLFENPRTSSNRSI